VGGVGRSALGQHIRRWSAAVGAWVDAMIGHRQKLLVQLAAHLGKLVLGGGTLPSRRCRGRIQWLPSRFDMDDGVRGIWNITMSRARMPFSTTATGYVSK
jgi:hypothetical protein